ncbi:FAD-dependent oxidoreductase [Mycobacteroides salmoniphilum]|uniref:Pentachlorophenol 4-monooxygenase n=1 Tax=Mycobacteroides salmoniphilum TaxID=404941 RepID=A0A4V3I0A9_9MYCO|nr:FAD-dependent oxidoreductase [Mycobacteroides salmoniphilum]TDZ99814.1 Pentachlorophenol 4-monooxygenase [Mycobacteroides salmoniphilum]
METGYDCDVLVVGAGPSGLCTALLLAQHGVRVRVIDRKPGPVQQSRATIVHARTLEYFDRLGVAEHAVACGLPITHVAIHENGRHVGELPLAGKGTAARTRFPYALALEQFATERLLVAALARHGTDVEWCCAVEDIAEMASGVRVGIQGPMGVGSISARWLVGADGASSTIRRLTGQEFHGETYTQKGLLADVDMEVDLGIKKMRLNLTRGGFVGVLPLASGRYRLFGVVPPDFHRGPEAEILSHDAYARLDDGDLRHWFESYFSVEAKLQTILWAAMFRFHSRISKRFRVNHSFLVGDAAHIHNPAGGQGLNLAVGDAVNLGWKLAQVVNGEAPASLLETYETERRPVAAAVLARTDIGFKLETSTSPLALWMRTHVATRAIGLACRLPPVRKLFFDMFSQLWINYRTSTAIDRSDSSGRGPHPGDRAPYAALISPRGSARSVMALTHPPNYHALLIGAIDPCQAAHLRSLLTARYTAEVATHVLTENETEVCRAYRVIKSPKLVLVRPDGHIAAIVDPFNWDTITYVLRHLDEVLLRADQDRGEH